MNDTATNTRPQASTKVMLRRVAGYAGIAGPLFFVGCFLIQEAVRRDEFDWIAEPVSALAIGPDGWIQNVNFVVLGLLTIPFAIGLQLGMAPSRGGLVGPIAMTISGVAPFLAATFPLQADAAGETVYPAGHVAASTVFFLSSAVALVALSRRMLHDARWRSLATYALIAGGIGLACFVGMGTLVIPDDAPLHDWAGLLQRLIVVLVLFPCRIALAVRLVRTTQNA